ncbi:cation:proton antiporter [Pseudomonas sp. PLMAX]|uniref:cation:proton antiporter n=1 Tax=Pseudomonas sp. PLMAX TaxID=2201998 RepID=UPI0038BBBADB
MLDLVAGFIFLTTLMTWFNYKFLKLPPAIGVMVTALLLSVALQIVTAMGYPILELHMQKLIASLDFSTILMTWFLPALLFAGALHVNLNDLRSYKWAIGLLATVGVLISTVVVGVLAYYMAQFIGWQVSFLYCLLFGALISPTDPIAVMGILKTSGAPKPMRMVIVGESLFNDGTAVVVFSILIGILMLGHTPTPSDITVLFLQEAVGGIVYGVVLGTIGFMMLRTIDQHQVSVMLTLAIVFGGSALATKLHVSSPIAMVVVGLIIGNHGRNLAMSENSRRYVDGLWELIDDVLNSLLFTLIGLELLLLPFTWVHIGAGLVLAVVVLMSRVLTVSPAILLMRMRHRGDRQITKGTIRTLSWGGLRGGVSVALALSLPLGEQRDLVLTLTYIVVLASILVQGLTIGKLVKLLFGEKKPKAIPENL